MATSLTTIINTIIPDQIGEQYSFASVYLMDVLREFCTRSHIVNDGFKHDVASSDPDATLNKSISITTPTAYSSWQPCEIMRLKINGIDYAAKERAITENIDDIDEIEETKTKFWYLSGDTTIVMYPFENIAVQLYLQMAFKPTDSVAELDDKTYRDWNDVIRAGVMAKLLNMPKKEWYDPAAARENRYDYERGIGRAIRTVLYNHDSTWRNKGGFI